MRPKESQVLHPNLRFVEFYHRLLLKKWGFIFDKIEDRIDISATCVRNPTSSTHGSGEFHSGLGKNRISLIHERYSFFPLVTDTSPH